MTGYIQSENHIQDLRIIEEQIRYVQANKFYGNITFSFKDGILCPIISRNETKEIKKK